MKTQGAKQRKETHGFLAAIVASSRDAIIVVDTDGSILSWNPGAERIFGYTDQEAIGSPVFVLVPEDKRAEAADYLRRLNMGEEIIAPDTLWRRKNGSTVNVSMILNPVKYPSRDVIAYCGILRDITGEKRNEEKLRQALREKERLLRELHHRMNNNLQIVLSLLSFQSAEIADPQVVEKFKTCQNRVKAIAMVHDMLYRREHSDRLILKDYIEAIGSRLLSGDEGTYFCVRLNVKGDATEVGLEACVSLGLIASELITNALQHAFLKREGNVIVIEVRQQPPGNLRLGVGDNGRGFPEDFDWEHAETFGLTLIQSAVKKLKGTLRFSRENGTLVNLNVPLLQETQEIDRNGEK